MNLLANSCDLAFSTAALVAGCEIVYSRGTAEATIQAIAGTQAIQQMTDFDNLLVKRWRESFLVKPADLLSVFGEPAAGDQIRYTPPGRPDIVLTFTLRPDESNQPVFRPTDRFHTRWRLNTILTGKTEAAGT